MKELALTTGPIEVDIAATDGLLGAALYVPREPLELVIAALASGSARFSTGHRALARSLADAGLAVLLVDLLTPREEAGDVGSGRFRFDVELLEERIEAARAWALADPRLADLPVGLLGSGTAAAAAIAAAARRPHPVRAVVARGGRADLAGDDLRFLRVPTLLIVGSADLPGVALARDAMRKMNAPVRLDLIAGAGPSFEEPGAPERVAALVSEWFLSHLDLPPSSVPRRATG
jgi:dienelactone hydrolase